MAEKKHITEWLPEAIADMEAGTAKMVCVKGWSVEQLQEFFDRESDDDLHARIVQTLTRHGGLNTYELADEIVKAVVEGARP